MRTIKSLLLIVLLLTAAACGAQPPATPTQAPAEPTAAPAPTEAPVEPTTAPAATDTPVAETPTEAPTEAPTAEPIALPGICDYVDPTSLALNYDGEWQADCVPGGAFTSDGPFIAGLPEHIQINFDGRNASTREPGDPVLYIIPADAYQALWDEGGNTLVGERLGALRTWVGRRPVAVSPQNMPVLPVEEAQATNDLAVQGTYLNFGDWDGIRFVGRFVQDPQPVTNEGLRYIFQGFAGANDEYLVAFFYPVSTTLLPATMADVSAEDMSAFEADPAGALALRATELNTLTAGDWQPMLDELDAMIGSLQYGGEETGAELPEIEGETEEGRQDPHAVVSGASGVNIRTGPSTVFPSLGIAPFGAQLDVVGRSLDGNWWVTPVQGAPNGQGWVSAGFVEAFFADSVPVVAGPPIPTPVPQPTATPVAPRLNFWADRATINQGECTTLRWSVENIQAVWVYPVGENWQNHPATGNGSRQVCPMQTTTWEMRVQLRDGSITTQQVTVIVNPGNQLANTGWVMTRFGGSGLPLPGRAPSITFHVGNTLDGFGGCNTIGGTYSQFGADGLAISAGTRSLILCEDDVMAQQEAFLNGLHTTAAFTIEGNTLIMRDGSGVETLRFQRQ